jgi:hypothetical protein
VVQQQGVAVTGSAQRWQPAIGERVVLVKTGETGTVLQLAPTEWGLLCDIDLDPQPAQGRAGERRVHAATELQPLHPATPPD